MTAAPLSYAIEVLERNKIKNYFDEIISGQDLSNNKPHPEPYLFAASKLKIKPKDCIVFEDSKNGIISAKEAKMFCIGLKTKFGKNQDLSRADLLISKYSNIKIEELKKIKSPIDSLIS